MSAPPAVRRTRTLDECAAAIGVSVKTVRRMVRAGELPARWVGNYYLVSAVALEKYLKDIESAYDGVA